MLNECVLRDKDKPNPVFKAHYKIMMDMNVANTLVTCNIAEDNLGISRYVDWHFFNPDRREYENLPLEDINPDKLIAELEKHMPELGKFLKEIAKYGKLDNDLIFLSIVRRFSTHLAQVRFTRNIGNGKFYREIGRVLHYIDDMAVPAHVVPVFHPYVRLSSPYFCSDPFDKYEIQLTENSLKRELNCEEIAESVSSLPLATDALWELLEQAANDTHAHINQSICGKDTWKEIFWPEVKFPFLEALGLDDFYLWFGNYAQNNFGVEGVVVTCINENGEESRNQIRLPAYEKFAEIRHKVAIFTSVKVLLWAARYYESHQSSSPPIGSNNTVCPLILSEEPEC